MKKDNLKIEQVSISLLKPAEYNPRKLTSKQEEVLTKSIKEYKLLDPIVVNKFKDRKNIIISGHQRMKVAEKLGYKEVPVVFVSLPPEKEKELNLLMNKATGEWDFELLKQFDVEILLETGFNDSDISAIWDEHLETTDDEFEIEKEIKKIKTTKIKLGDIFQLGNSYLICADSTDPKTIKKLLGNNKADMIYMDPPFNIGLDYAKGIGKSKNYGGLVDDNKTETDYKDLLKKTITNALAVSKKDVHCFYYCDPLHIGMIQSLYEELGIINKRVAMWIKNNQNPTPQVAFNRMYEPVVYGVKGKPYLSDIKNTSEILNKEIENGNRTIDDILDLLDIWLVKRLPSAQYGHPTEKSPTLHEKALRRCTKVGDIVLDLFAGSGSTLIACEQLKRKCFTAELNPIFCQLTINRYEKYANKKAKKLN